MRRKIVVAALLCLALVAMMALAAAPIASAKAVFTEVSGIERYEAVDPDPTLVFTGSVAHTTFNNVMRIDSDYPTLAGYNYTHMVVVFDPDTGEGICHGTYRLELDDGVSAWEGTFAGAITLTTLAQVWNIHTTGRGVSGTVAGMISRGHDLNGYVTAVGIDPHGL